MHTIVRRFDVGDQRARALLAGSGLSIEMQGRPIGQLSGGQKARLGMAAAPADPTELLSPR
jgi:ATPase subunit of ABC transporter with duplicated ATPase domains